MTETNRDTTFNYLGELFLVGAYGTPFLNMMGGISGARSKKTTSMIFPVAQPYTLGAAVIPTITETALNATVGATTRARAIDINTVQIFLEAVEVSYLRQAAYGELTTLAALGDQPVKDEFAFQKMAALKHMVTDMELTFLTGTYAAATGVGVAAQTNGIITACTSNNTVVGGYIDKAHIDEGLREAATNGAVFENMVMFVNAFQKTMISDIYGYAPDSRNVGGVNIQQIETDFAKIGVVYTPQMPTGTILCADMNYVYPVFMPIKGEAVLYEDLARISGTQKGHIVSFAGIDYGPQEYHITWSTCTAS